jgi:hypothetical protein
MQGWDQSKFDSTLEEYSKVSKRTHAEIVNTKAFYIARKAIWFTPKADSYKMKQQLGGIVTVKAIGRKGKMVKRRQLQLVTASQHAAPLAALIVNARRGKQGMPGLYGKEMEKAIREMLAGRAKSVGFLKSGWLEAVHVLAPLVKDKSGASPSDPAARQVGRPKGDATPAQPGDNPSAEIVNLASARRDYKGALIRFGEPALQQAITDEEFSMRDYIDSKMKPDADAFNSKQ